MADRRWIACNCFIFDLFSGSVNSFYILLVININIPERSLRNFTFLRPEFYRTDYENSKPVTNMITLSNSVSYLFDFSLSRGQFIRNINNLFGNRNHELIIFCFNYKLYIMNIIIVSTCKLCKKFTH